MATYTYKANTGTGQVETGQMEADSREALVRQLRAEGKYCYEVKEREATEAQRTPLKLREISVFCRQLASMLSAGINMSRALHTVYQSNTSKRMKAAALALYESVLKGNSLSQSMQQMGKFFPELLIYMVETGETSGTLDSILESMAAHYDQELYLKKKAQSAMIYPAILCVVTVFVVVFMLTVVFPQFITMYNGVALPAPTRVLMGISDGLQAHWEALLALALGGALLFAFLMTKRPFRVIIGRIQLKLPVVGKLQRTIITSRFASTFAILYASGIGIFKSVDVLSRVMNNAYVEDALLGVQEGLRQGNMLSSSLMEIQIFDPMLITSIEVGEESGMLEDMMRKIGVYFSREAETAMTNMVALIEPVMIVLMGGIVGFIVIAAITPVFSMYSQLG